MQVPVDPDEDFLNQILRRRQIRPNPTITRRRKHHHLAVPIALVLLLILFTVAISIVLKPRGRDMPPELSQTSVAPTTFLV